MFSGRLAWLVLIVYYNSMIRWDLVMFADGVEMGDFTVVVDDNGQIFQCDCYKVSRFIVARRNPAVTGHHFRVYSLGRFKLNLPSFI